MEINNELTAKIEEMAENLTPASQMAAVLDIDENELIAELQKHNSALRRAYFRGIYATQDTIRKMNIELAGAGSPEAIRNCIQDMHNMLNELV